MATPIRIRDVRPDPAPRRKSARPAADEIVCWRRRRASILQEIDIQSSVAVCIEECPTGAHDLRHEIVIVGGSASWTVSRRCADFDEPFGRAGLGLRVRVTGRSPIHSEQGWRPRSNVTNRGRWMPIISRRSSRRAGPVNHRRASRSPSAERQLQGQQNSRFRSCSSLARHLWSGGAAWLNAVIASEVDRII